MNMQSFRGHRTATRVPSPLVDSEPDRITAHYSESNFPELPVRLEVRDRGKLYSRSYHPNRYFARRMAEADKAEILEPFVGQAVGQGAKR